MRYQGRIGRSHGTRPKTVYDVIARTAVRPIRQAARRQNQVVVVTESHAIFDYREALVWPLRRECRTDVYHP